MAVGDRIKRVRNFRGMTMKELGMAVGFDEKSADVRIAQYENNSRKPKEELMGYDRLVLCACTYDGGIFPPMEDFLHHLKAKAYQNRILRKRVAMGLARRIWRKL